MMAPSSGGERACQCFLQRAEDLCWEETEDEQEARKVQRMKEVHVRTHECDNTVLERVESRHVGFNQQDSRFKSLVKA
jgi:hypothetical protein